MKILIIKPSSFGDIVQALPAANALKQIYGDAAKISWVVFENWKEIVELSLDIDEVVVWNKKEGLKGFFKILKKLRKTEFDLIIDLQGLLRSAFLARFSKGKIKLGVPGMKEFSNVLIKEVFPQKAKMNATLRNLEPIKFLSDKPFEIKVRLKIQDFQSILSKNQISDNFIVLLPFARGKGKDWSVENYNKLISIIKSSYTETQIVILGLSKDKNKIQGKDVIDLCGETNIKQLTFILSKALVSVGADTGSMHLSSVLNTPSVFIFGKSDINETAPYLGNFTLMANEKNKNEINEIAPEEVFYYVKEWIDKRIKK